MLRPYLAGIPDYLKAHGRFCLWRYENERKPPYQISGRPADVSRPETFTTFSEVVPLLPDYDGLGVLLQPPIACIDLDHCIQGGKLSGTAQKVLDMIPSYAERSPSGEGVHIFFRLPAGFCFDSGKYMNKNSEMGIEIYVSNRYMTCSGHYHTAMPRDLQISDPSDFLEEFMQRETEREATTLTGCGEGVSTIRSTHWNYQRSVNVMISDSALLKKAMESRGGAAFAALWNGDISGYGSPSEADAALCGRLAYWCARDASRMDALFRKSGLMRDKWDSKRLSSTYGQITIQKAIKSCNKTYDPGRREQN